MNHLFPRCLYPLIFLALRVFCLSPGVSQKSRAVTVYSHTDTVMLNLMTADKNIIGVYTCAAKLKGLLPMLTGALWAAALPRSSALWQKQDIPTFRELAGKSFHVVTMITIPLILYFCLFVEPWIHIIGGKEYLDAAQTMQFLLPAVIAIGYSNILGGQMLIPMGQEWETALCGTYRCLQQYSSECPADSLWSASGAAIATLFYPKHWSPYLLPGLLRSRSESGFCSLLICAEACSDACWPGLFPSVSRH